MKLTKILSISMILVITMATVVTANNIFTVKTALNTQSAQKSLGISVLSGEVLEFSAEDLELRLGLKPQSLSGITITRLPKNGALVLEGVDVEAYDFINRDEVNNLCFVPNEDAVAASLTFIPRAGDVSTAELTISVLTEPNLPPEVQSLSIDTAKNIAVSGYIQASDPEGDKMSVRVINPPVNGSVRIDGLSFNYTPYRDFTGKDSFTVCVVDTMSNFSKQATVNVNVETQRTAFAYEDMAMHPSAYAAVKLRENGVMTGAKIGDKYFFAPNEQTTRGEFFVMLIAASGLEASMKPTVNTGLPNDTEIPYYLKPYVKKAIDEDIWSKTQAFYHSQIPTRAEAVVLVDRAAKINDVRDFKLTMHDVSELPDWAVPSYKDLAAYRMLDLYDNMARPVSALTNGYSADLLWQLWKHSNK